MQSSEVDLEDKISEVEQSEPFITITSKPGTESSQIFVCCESQIFLEVKSMIHAMLDMMSAFYVFDVSYPKSLHAMLIFIQHHVFGLEDQQTVPSTVKTLITNLKKL